MHCGNASLAVGDQRSEAIEQLHIRFAPLLGPIQIADPPPSVRSSSSVSIQATRTCSKIAPQIRSSWYLAKSFWSPTYWFFTARRLPDSASGRRRSMAPCQPPSS